MDGWVDGWMDGPTADVVSGFSFSHSTVPSDVSSTGDRLHCFLLRAPKDDSEE
jgi:hypothetical protein